MKVANSEVNEGETPVVNSRYSIVMATAKRARELIDGDVYKRQDITVNIRGVGIGSCDICRFVCYFSLNHGI